MIYIYDSTIDPEELARQQAQAARDKAEIDAEVAGWQQQKLVNAWNELQAVPSYVEEQARLFASTPLGK